MACYTHPYPAPWPAKRGRHKNGLTKGTSINGTASWVLGGFKAQDQKVQGMPRWHLHRPVRLRVVPLQSPRGDG